MQEGDDLPPEIEQRLDPASGYAYYYNTETQQSAWTLSEVATAAVVDEVPRGGDPAAVQGDNGIELGSWADLTSPVTPPRGASEVPSHIDEMLDSNGVPYYVDRTTGQSAWSPEELTSGGGAADAAEMEAAEMAVMGSALVGSCLGFLYYNAHPAEVFMGDSGSLPVGGLLAWMAMVAKQELVLPLLGFVFFAELGSSALQRVWYKRTGGQRLFTMAPIHHGLQTTGGIFRPGKKEWHEATIVTRAWIVAAVCAMASLALLKVR